MKHISPLLIATLLIAAFPAHARQSREADQNALMAEQIRAYQRAGLSLVVSDIDQMTASEEWVVLEVDALKERIIDIAMRDGRNPTPLLEPNPFKQSVCVASGKFMNALYVVAVTTGGKDIPDDRLAQIAEAFGKISRREKLSIVREKQAAAIETPGRRTLPAKAFDAQCPLLPGAYGTASVIPLPPVKTTP